MQTMWKRYQEYVQENPFQGWQVSVSIGFLIVMALYQVFHLVFGMKSTPLMPLTTFSPILAPPTIQLAQRFSEERLRKNPLPPHHLEEIGRFSVVAALISFLLIVIPVLAGHFHSGISFEFAMSLIGFSPLPLLLAIVFGSLAHRTSAGRWGIGILLGGLGLTILWFIVKVLIHLAR